LSYNTLYVVELGCLSVNMLILQIFLILTLTTVITTFLSPVYSQGASNNASDNKLQDNSTNTTVTSAAVQNNQDKSKKEISNEKIVRNFYNDVFIAKNASAAINYLEPNYIQHNPNVPTGREALINVFTKIFQQNPNFNTQIQRIYTDGDHVIVHSFSLSKSSSNAIVDIYRINDNGKIAEHWDVIQPIPTKPANNNTMFYLK
jgi:predicted SnoaL-like aldol condensation-catalyzing enzyme